MKAVLEKQGYSQGKHTTWNTTGSVNNNLAAKRTTFTPAGYFNPSLVVEKDCSVQVAIAEQYLTWA